MNKKRIAQFLPTAMREADALLPQQAEDGSGNVRVKMPSAIRGYVAAFGPCVIANGLLPTMILYLAENSEAKRQGVAKAIMRIAGIADIGQLFQRANSPGYREKMLDASIALKLALATFEDDEKK